MTIGGYAQQQNPLAMAIGQQNLSGFQEQQMSEEQRRKRQDAIWAALDEAYRNMNSQKNIQNYFLAGAGGGGGMGF